MLDKAFSCFQNTDTVFVVDSDRIIADRFDVPVTHVALQITLKLKTLSL